MGQHQLGEMGLSKAIGVQMKELGVAGGLSVQCGHLLLMQICLEAMAMGQADVGSPSPCPIAWPRQSPQPHSPSGCLKAGRQARIPVLCWGACRSLGCMAAFGACFVFSRRVPAGSNPAPSSGEDAMPRLSRRLFLGVYPALPPCTAPQGGECPQREGIWPQG